MKKTNTLQKLYTYGIYFFACIGLMLTGGFFAVKFGLTNETGIIDTQKYTFSAQKDSNYTHTYKAPSGWEKTEDWGVLKQAIIRDREAIYKASALFDVKPRLVVAILMVEQLRVFNDNREVFKTVFAPLKILGVQSQFSWGVVGVKRETAIQTEENLKNPSSSFYPGKQYENLLNFTTNDIEQERFERLTSQKNRLYSYIYTAAIIKELEAQWLKSGYTIETKPEIVSTLFNIGFSKSKPNASPKSGGASITIGSQTYSFGSLAGEFYYSDELLDLFPR